MNKIQTSLFIEADKIELDERGKIIVVNGQFYFQGKKYTIVNKEIINEK